MFAKIIRILRRPGYYWTVFQTRIFLKRCAALMRGADAFTRKPFRWQAQMDIHPTSLWHKPDFVSEYGGFSVPGDPVVRQVTDEFDATDLVRRDALVLLMRTIVSNHIPGALAELGVYRGMTARLIHHYVPERPLHLFDTFSGFAAGDTDTERVVTGLEAQPGDFSDTNEQLVLLKIEPRQRENIILHPGIFPASVPPQLFAEKFAFVHIDADLYAPILSALHFFYPRISKGGIIVVHDYNAWPGARRAVDEFLKDKPEIALPLPDKSGSAVIVMQQFAD